VRLQREHDDREKHQPEQEQEKARGSAAKAVAHVPSMRLAAGAKFNCVDGRRR
jgi:hypothetical protein